MTGMLDGGYRDETRIVHMLQALERIEQETRETSRDKLFSTIVLRGPSFSISSFSARLPTTLRKRTVQSIQKSHGRTLRDSGISWYMTIPALTSASCGIR